MVTPEARMLPILLLCTTSSGSVTQGLIKTVPWMVSDIHVERIVEVDSFIHCAVYCGRSTVCSHIAYNGPGSDETEADASSNSQSPGNCKLVGCLEGWTFNDDKCYFIQTTRASWPPGENNCAARRTGAHLASILSQEEEMFVSEMFTQEYELVGDDSIAFFIGLLCDPYLGCTWSDGSAVNYTNWAHNGYVASRHCGVYMSVPQRTWGMCISSPPPSICKYP